MIDPELIQYIESNLKNGFSADEIKAALREAGWKEKQINDGFSVSHHANTPPQPKPAAVKPGFIAKHKKVLALPVIGLIVAGAAALVLSNSNSTPSLYNRSNNGSVLGTASENSSPQERDLERVQEIGVLQEALAKYFTSFRVYPTFLDQLTATKTITELPKDPKSGKSYLYSALGDPPLNYSLTFFLEEGVGGAGAGLHIVSSDQPFPTETVLAKEQILSGNNNADLRPLALKMDQRSYSAGEEINITVTAEDGTPLKEAYLTLDSVSLGDSKPPLHFQLSAPATPGVYPLSIYAFDEQENGYRGKLSVEVDNQVKNN